MYLATSDEMLPILLTEAVPATTILTILGFLMMLVLNLLTPLIADDYAYSFIHGTYKRVHNLLDVIISQADHYMTWGGRSIAHSFAQTFLMLPKWVFSICNSGIYTLIIYHTR